MKFEHEGEEGLSTTLEDVQSSVIDLNKAASLSVLFGFSRYARNP